MSWTYSGNPASSELDAIRFELSDTDSSMPIFQDEEIQYVLNESSSKDQAMYRLFRSASTIFAKDVKRSLGPQSEDPTERIRFFEKKASEYKAKVVYSGISVPSYAYPKIFRKGMQNNPPWPYKGGY